MRVGIVCPGQMGDVCESTGLFAYREELWGAGVEIHWHVQEKFKKPLLNNPHVTIHCEEDRIPMDGLDKIYSTAPYMNWGLVWDVPLPMIPPRVLGLKLRGRPWRPKVYLTAGEVAEVREKMLPFKDRFCMMLETACFSHQGDWTQEMTLDLVDMVSAYPVTFFMASFDAADYFDAKGFDNFEPLDEFGYRQLAEVYNHCHAYVGVPSGAASVTCAERCKRLPRVELLNPTDGHARCPRKAGEGPDWGTGSMVPCYATSEPEKALSKATALVKTYFDGPRKRRRKLWG